MSARDVCDLCGSETFSEGRWSMGKLWCSDCFRGQRPAVAMPPSERGKAAIKVWLAPRPPRQQTLRLGELVGAQTRG